MCENSIN